MIENTYLLFIFIFRLLISAHVIILSERPPPVGQI